ncbi:MAG: hypothetical protein ACO1TE_25345 [Prosthecobacter sp.]
MVPELFENTIRIEVLTHISAACCEGDATPDARDLAEWIGKLMADSPIASAEDPAEDVFIGCINSKFGSFRVFQGNFVDGAFLVERLFKFYAEKATFPTFQETVESVLALLRLSDALAARSGFSRYMAGCGRSARRIQVPRWKELEPKVKSLLFSEEELNRLGVTTSVLQDLLFNDQHRIALLGERLWNSSLERRPFLPLGNGILVLSPSALCRTAMRYMVERMGIMGSWGETFYEQENAMTFVNDVGNHLRIDFKDFKRPAPPKGTPCMFPAFGAFDLGKPVILLTYTPPLAGAAQDFAGCDQLSDEEQSKFQFYVQSCANELEKVPGFSGGMILLCLAGYGRGYDIWLDNWSPQWQVYSATLCDWLLLTADGEVTAMRLWKLGQHEAACAKLGVEVLNPAGLPNLVASWRHSGFRLVQRETDILSKHNLIVLDCGFARSIRVLARQKRDEHCLPSPSGGGWTRIVRHNSTAFFPEDKNAPIYAAFDEARARLVGCAVHGHTVWWIVAPPRPERPELLGLLFQLWDCTLNWANHLIPVLQRVWPELCGLTVEVCLDLPDFARWSYGRLGFQLLPDAKIRTAISLEYKRVTITIPEGFLQSFNVPQNVAEQNLVTAMCEGAAQLLGISPTSEEIQRLTSKIVRNEDARYFHIVNTHEIEQVLGSQERPCPLFFVEEDMTLCQLGLADLAGRPSQGNVFRGTEECRQFLQDTVTKIWERIETRLRAFDRTSVIFGCFRALDEVVRDEAHWNLTTRSLFALHDDEDDTKGVLRHRRSQRSAANLGNRLLIETAQYACTNAGAVLFNAADHGSLLAEITLLIQFAYHRDAIAFGFLKPEVTVHPNGEIEVDERFYSQLFNRYLGQRSDVESNYAKESYKDYFNQVEPFSQKQSDDLDVKMAKFDEVFLPEFGFSSSKLVMLCDVFRKFALESKSSAGILSEAEILPLLCRGCDFAEHEAFAFLDRLALPIRAGWDKDLPSNCKKDDVYPWKFRRNLSLLVRPLVQISQTPRSWVISSTFLDKSISYLCGNIEKGRLPERCFRSEQMRKHIGRQVDRRGHAFAEKVHQVFLDSGFSSHLEVEMSKLGAQKKDGLGDVDVLAWDRNDGRVFVVECKRLQPVLTAREIIQRLEDFRGDKKAKDSLGRHLRRVDWLMLNQECVSQFVGMSKEVIQVIPLLVTSDLVPMRFFDEMDFPPKQVVAVGDLANVLR